MKMIEQKFFKQMQSQIDASIRLPEAAWNDLVNLFQQVVLKKGEHVVLPGDATSGLYFVCSGLLRYYYITDDGKEWNKAFVAEDTLTASFSEDFLGYPSPYGIQALENSILLSARYADFEGLYERHNSAERLGRRFVEQVLAVKLARERSFLQNDAKARYRDFLRQHPGLCERIPQYQLASYLGVSDVTLSRLRGQMLEIKKTPNPINKC